MTLPLRLVCHLRGANILSWLFTLLLAAGASAATKKPPLQPINLNAATSEELQQVPGIGPATADKILQMRKSYGAFKSVDDLLAIRGIGKKRLDKMRKYLTTGKPAPAPAKKSPLGQPAAGNACKDVVPPAKAATLSTPENSQPRKTAPPPPTQDDEDEEPE
jgi:competence protein ComEA